MEVNASQQLKVLALILQNKSMIDIHLNLQHQLLLPFLLPLLARTHTLSVGVMIFDRYNITQVCHKSKTENSSSNVEEIFIGKQYHIKISKKMPQ